MRRIILAALAAVLAFVFIGAGPVHAKPGNSGKAGKGGASMAAFYNHRFDHPVVTVYDGTTSTGWNVASALTQWSAASPNLTLVSTSDPATADIYVHENSDIAYAGVASYTTDNGGYRITHCDVTLSTYYAVNYPSVMHHDALHEIGHCLGLDHNTQDVKGSVMNKVVSVATAVTKPSPYDLTNLRTAYASAP